MKGRNKQKLVYIISNVEKSLAFEWLAMELSRQYRLSFVLLNPSGSSLERFLMDHSIPVTTFRFRHKGDYPKAFLQVLWYLVTMRPDVAHMHLLDAQLIGLTAAWLAGIKKRIYTRHNSNFHHVYFPRGVRYDKLSNQLATQIVSISQATYATLVNLEGVPTKKIRSIYHGFNLFVYSDTSNRKVELMQAKWNIPAKRPRIGVIARHIEWKGIQHIIPAFRKLLDRYPSAVLLLANAHGPYHEALLRHLADIPRPSYVLIPFEQDVATLYAMFDLYVHVPVDPLCEAFGQTYVEALAAGVPSIFTRSGVAAEFVNHKQNAWVVDYQSPEEIFLGMITLLNNPALQCTLRDTGKQSVKERFDIRTMVSKLQQLYDE